MNGLPSVSVIVPCYQAEAYIAATLRSVLNQTHSPLEVLVVDNNSTDRGPEIAAGFGAPVRVLHVSECGAARARVAGAAEAIGETLMFLDADDLIAPGTLEALAEGLAATPGTIAICPWNRLSWVDDGSEDDRLGLGLDAGGFWLIGPPSCAGRRRGHDDLTAWLSHWWHPPCSVLWSRESYWQSGGWDPRTSVNDDGELMMRAFLRGLRLTRVRGGRGFYRRLPDPKASLSGRRHAREGVTAELAVLARVERQLLARGDHARYAGPLKRAYRMVAAHAGDAHPDLVAFCAAAGDRLKRSPDAAPAPLPAGAPNLGPPPEPGTGLLGRRAEEIPRLAPPAVASEPLVSVIIPTYNRAELVARAAQSALAQDWSALEVIVVDDASNDDTAARLEGLGDPRLRLIRQPRNGGVARARNRGMNVARGEIFGFLDSDDEWLPHKLSLQVPTLLSAPRRTAIVHGASECIFADGTTSMIAPPPTGRLFRTLLERNVLHAFGTIPLVRREVVETVGGFDPSLPAIEDWEFAIRAARFFDVTAVDAPVVRYWDVEGDRRSLKVAANLQARHMLHHRYHRDMREAGVETAFLKETARRHLVSGASGRLPAARTLLSALRRAPLNPGVYAWLAYCGLPREVEARISGFRRSRA